MDGICQEWICKACNDTLKVALNQGFLYCVMYSSHAGIYRAFHVADCVLPCQGTQQRKQIFVMLAGCGTDWQTQPMLVVGWHDNMEWYHNASCRAVNVPGALSLCDGTWESKQFVPRHEVPAVCADMDQHTCYLVPKSTIPVQHGMYWMV